ncbi:MAG: hypothetical protein QW179_03750 [Candidatus Hadarchaeales archaeon]
MIEKIGQGATEYKLILAIVLFVVAGGIAYLSAVRPSSIGIYGEAKMNGDNVIFIPSTIMTPPILYSETWSYSVYREASRIYPPDTDWAIGPLTLERNVPASFAANGSMPGDILKIRYQGEVFNINIRA